MGWAQEFVESLDGRKTFFSSQYITFIVAVASWPSWGKPCELRGKLRPIYHCGVDGAASLQQQTVDVGGNRDET